MKRVILDGTLVINVEVVTDLETEGLIVPDNVWVGPGTIWNEDLENPVFTAPE